MDISKSTTPAPPPAQKTGQEHPYRVMLDNGIEEYFSFAAAACTAAVAGGGGLVMSEDATNRTLEDEAVKRGFYPITSHSWRFSPETLVARWSRVYRALQALDEVLKRFDRHNRSTGISELRRTIQAALVAAGVREED